MRVLGSVRLTVGVVAALAAALALPAVPVLAGPVPTTRYVDDDGHAGRNQGCDGTHAAAELISDAVAVSGADDTILVCPGTYREQVSVDVPGLTIAGVSAWKAHVKPPLVLTTGASSPSGFDQPVMYVTADDVTISGLNVIVPAHGACDYQMTGILAEGASGLSVSGNRISGGGGNPTMCGLSVGVAWSNLSTGTISQNLVRAFTSTGIWINAASAVVRQNTVELFSAPTCATAIVCSAPRPSVAPAGGFASLRGILVAYGQALVKENLITVPDGAAAYSAMTSGVEAFQAAYGKGIRAVGNRIVGASVGIGLSESFGKVHDNVVRRSVTDGISLYYSNGLDIAGNRVARSGNDGMRVDANSAGNAIHDNDFSGNTNTDCVDESGSFVPSQADPIDNTWTANYGDEDSPDGICTPKV